MSARAGERTEALEVDTSWHGRGACIGESWELFYPEEDQAHALRLARGICAECPMVQVCLQAALDTPPQDDWGVWGGTSRAERMAMRRQRAQGVAA